MSAIVVTLSPSELLHGAMCGVYRQVQNIRRRRRDRFGAEVEAGWQLHICGALGELAVAKHLGRYWIGMGVLGDLEADDFAGGQVRWATRPTDRLILHESDPDNARFVLVTGVTDEFLLHGWILGSDGKQKRFWNDPVGGRPAFFVPRSELRDIRAW